MNDTRFRIMPALVIVLTVGIFAAVPAYAYVDPGSGQLLLQALGVVFFGAAFYLRQIVAVLSPGVTPQLVADDPIDWNVSLWKKRLLYRRSPWKQRKF